MDKEGIKKHLYENTELIEKILEDLGCHNIKTIPNKRVTSSLPDGDNPSSIQVLLDENLKTKIWTRNDYERKEYKDIFTLVEYLKNYTFPEAIKFICNSCNLEYDGKIKEKQLSSRSVLKGLVRNKKKELKKEQYTEFILDNKLKEQFVNAYSSMFLNDGINEIAQDKFEVMYDVLDNRIVFPIKNDNGKILSFKGRTCEENYKILGIPKYIYYYKIEGKYYLFGLYENYFDILQANECIVFEAEKSPMQCCSFGVNNTVSINKKIISDEQLEKLIKLKVEVTLAFDKDVELNDIFIECRKFKGLCKVNYIYDYDGLLKDKMSPSDLGKEVFMQLYENYKFEYKGE